MEAKTLQQIKDEIAVKHGYTDWNKLCRDNWSELDSIEPYLNEASELYAQQMCEKQREICAEKAEVITPVGLYVVSTDKNAKVSVDKTSILTAPLATDKK